ncbi:hypothetical protein ACE1AT_25225 [Pelatocladus sp. BLCC-F211]|uniref:hypothetical protein n=1 Tax=Pelatocladus sp. BLCC-F211 TaxID=3342752 RepID=UPI0035B96073
MKPLNFEPGHHYKITGFEQTCVFSRMNIELGHPRYIFWQYVNGRKVEIRLSRFSVERNVSKLTHESN